MPYQNVDELPDKVKKALEKSQLPKFLKAFNAAYAVGIKKYDDKDKAEEYAFKVAWSVFNKTAEAMMADNIEEPDDVKLAEAIDAQMGELTTIDDNHITGQVWHTGPVPLHWGGVFTEVWTKPDKLKELAQYLIEQSKQSKIEMGVETAEANHPGAGTGATMGQATKFGYNDTEIYMEDGEIFNTTPNENLIKMNKKGLLKKRGLSMYGDMKLTREDGKYWMDWWKVKRVDIVGKPATGKNLIDPSQLPAALAEANNATGGKVGDTGTDEPPIQETKEDNIMADEEKLAEAKLATVTAEKARDVALAEAKKATEQIEKYKEDEEVRLAEAKKAEIKTTVEKKVEAAIAEGNATPGFRDNEIEIGVALAEANRAELFDTHIELLPPAWKKEEVTGEPSSKDRSKNVKLAEATKAFNALTPAEKNMADDFGLGPEDFVEGGREPPKKDGDK